MTMRLRSGLFLGLALANVTVAAQPPATVPPHYDAALARRVGADDYGMRSYVLVLLRSGPHPMPDGPARDAMFQGHMANIRRLADAGMLATAGPADGKQGLRGLFVLAVGDLDAARRLVATDPAIEHGELVAEYHTFYGSAALMLLTGLHASIVRKSF